MTRLRTHATLFGVGYHNLLDTYLSPSEYTGTTVRILREHNRHTRLMKGNIAMQNSLQGNLAYCKSPTEDAKDIAGGVDWTIAWRYQWSPRTNLKVLAGPMAAAHLGFVYNTRNGNNPAQARAAVEYQIEVPLIGLMFSPNYTQSYYEIFSLGQYDHNVCVTTPVQAFNLNQMLSLDLPVGTHVVRVGYQCGIRQSHVNHLKTHDWTHTFLVGYVKTFQLVKPRYRTSEL